MAQHGRIELDILGTTKQRPATGAVYRNGRDRNPPCFGEFEDTIGTGGVLLRWLHGRHWSVELGWIDQFHADNNAGIWNHWLLGSGAYGKVRYRF